MPLKSAFLDIYFKFFLLLLTCLSDNVFMRKQRSESRRTRIAKVGILWATRDGEVQRDTAFMEDVTRSGAGLRIRFPLPVGFPLLLDVQDKICEATVRHCDRDGAEYFVGIQFDSPVEGLHFGSTRHIAFCQTT